MASTSRAVNAVNAVIACSAILGNGLVIFVMTVKRKEFSSFTNRLIRHQSIVDLVSGVFFLGLKVIRQESSPQVGDNIWGEFICRFINSDLFVWGLNVTSTYNLVVISLERFLATCYPVQHRNYCSLFKIKVSMCAAWVFAFVYSTSRLIRLNRVSQGRCVHARGEHTPISIFWIPFFIEYFIPVTLMTFFYVKILLMLRRKLAVAANANQRGEGVLSKAKRNVLETLLIAGTLFFVCWSPNMILRFILIAFVNVTDHRLVKDVLTAFTGLVMCNMSVNPVVYCFKYEHFRVQLMQFVRSTFRRNRVHAGGETSGTPSSVDPAQRSVATQSTM